MIVVKKDLLKLIMHFVLIIAVLALFTKLSVDAIILGALAMFIYQVKNERDAPSNNRVIHLFSNSKNN